MGGKRPPSGALKRALERIVDDIDDYLVCCPGLPEVAAAQRLGIPPRRISRLKEYILRFQEDPEGARERHGSEPLYLHLAAHGKKGIT